MTQMERIDVGRIKANNWRQGCFFPQVATQNIVERYFPHVLLEGVRFIIISQSCDIGFYREDEELLVEVLLVKPVPKPDNSLKQGRNPRRYHLEVRAHGSQTTEWFEASIDDRLKIDRHFCADFAPSVEWSLAENEIGNLVKWIVYRYIRSAFPDTFNSRIRGTKSKLKGLLKKEGTQYLSGIYLRITDDELPDDVPYEIELLGAMTKADYSDEMKRGFAVKHIADIEAILGGCEGIDVSSECRSEEEISLDMMRSFRRFTDYDYMSYDSETDTII